MTYEHVTVLLKETIDMLDVKPGGVYVDCTLGGGGHSRAVLEKLQGNGKLYAFDQDQWAIDRGESEWKEDPRVELIHSNFININNELSKRDVTGVDGIIFDLGVSSPQLDREERGFSYQKDAPLDMRMDRRALETARDVVNKYSQRELENIIWDYGEERWAKRIAEFIIQARTKEEVATTGQLVDIIKAAIPKGARADGPHPAKRTFQALRIHVNDELGALEESLSEAVKILKPKGRICVITFHSLEDRIVKKFIKSREGRCTCPPGLPQCACGNKRLLKNITRKPIISAQEELENNPRARSAKLRVAEKVNSSKN
ncbi:16S rRNA (cytosine1402-N4)-methyltransferase [Desulfitispora alkaliphila]|uniref:16S rRNA (cytosine(1402)-N(4))-methyltransferase RsmH n=1 Tax=Desulfitispora alkaliphila TaxID=622674 RepID=UPI003D228FFA